MNQTEKSGSAIFTPRVFVQKRRRLPMLALCLSLFLIGSCNESAGLFDFSNKPADLKKLTKAETVRYGYALQVAMMQFPQEINKLKVDEIKLALSNPDFSRKDGRNNIWQYRTEECVFDVYWREKVADNHISHVEFRQRRSVLDGTQPVVDPVQWECVQSIIQQRRSQINRGFSDI